MISWTKKGAQESGNPFYVNVFGKFFLAKLGIEILDFFNDKKMSQSWRELSEDDVEILARAIVKSPVYKKLKKEGLSDNKILTKLRDEFNIFHLSPEEFERKFKIDWPL